MSSLYLLTLRDFLFQVLTPHLFDLRDSLLKSEHSQHPVARISKDILPVPQKIICLGLSSCQFHPALAGSRTRRDAGGGRPTSPRPAPRDASIPPSHLPQQLRHCWRTRFISSSISIYSDRSASVWAQAWSRNSNFTDTVFIVIKHYLKDVSVLM